MNLLQMPVNAARRAICPEHEKQPRRPLPDIALEEWIKIVIPTMNITTGTKKYFLNISI